MNLLYKETYLKALKEREALIRKVSLEGKPFNWQTYRKTLENLRLTKYQREAVVGLLLSDASIECGTKPKVTSLKAILEEHEEFLKHIQLEVLKEYSSRDTLMCPSKNRPNMLEFDTLMCSQFSEVAKPFYGSSLWDQKNTKKLRKAVFPEIKPYITPVSIAYWFMGDGGKLSPDGKAITLHSQGFTKQENELLASYIRDLTFEDNLKLDAKVKWDYDKKDKQGNVIESFYRIDISGLSFKCFIDNVSPFIIESMCQRIPPPRLESSKYPLEKSNVRSSFFKKNPDWLFTYGE